MYGDIIIIIVVYIIKVFTYHMPQAGMTDYIASTTRIFVHACMYVCVYAPTVIHTHTHPYMGTHALVYVHIRACII
jgi:hypothetical protein